jgi:SAM-dependent methyltransferase
MGLITQAGGCFHLTVRAREHLVAGSPYHLGPYYAALRDRPQTLDMVKVLRTGKPANWGSYDASAWAKSMERPDFAAQFTAAMDCRGVYLGQALTKKVDLSGAKRLLDIAGGSGIYACAFAARYAGLSAAVFERPPVDRIAREAIAKQGGSDRVEVIAGDMFADPLPTGFDAHLISNVLHDWDEAEVQQIVAKSYAALEPGGLLIVHDEHLNAEKTGPLAVAQYSVLLMHSTEGKCYSLSEMRAYLTNAGFEWMSFTETAADRSAIVVQKPAD